MTAARGGLSEERLREIERRRYCPDDDCRWPTCEHGAMARELLALREEVEKLERDRNRLRQERFDALDARTTCNMSAAEWQIRTGRAERERREALAERDSMREALRKYGRHGICYFHPEDPDAFPCTCGLRAALGGQP